MNDTPTKHQLKILRRMYKEGKLLCLYATYHHCEEIPEFKDHGYLGDEFIADVRGTINSLVNKGLLADKGGFGHYELTDLAKQKQMNKRIKSNNVLRDSWLLKNGKPKRMRVCAILDLDYFPEQFSGIPITPDTLYRHTPLRYDGALFWTNSIFGDINFKFKKNGFYQVCGFTKIGVKIEFLHELQLRVLSLTGIEMAITGFDEFINE